MINIAVLGFGVVGSGVYDVIEMNSAALAEKLGDTLRVKRILDLREFPGKPYEKLVTKDFDLILRDDEISVVVECMGGSHPAFDYSLAALKVGKSVVTSNKEVVANFGSELISAAKESGAKYRFEASVGGGIPLIHPLCECMSVNVIESVAGILNGTTNYILTRMFEEGASFGDALSEAQKMGYAERDPAADVDGLDAARKIAILSDIAYGREIPVSKVRTEGIRNISSRDVDDALKSGYKIKLLGYSKRCGDRVYCIVCPFFVSSHNILSGVRDVFNGVSVCGNAVGTVMFYGRGAGKLPTASAMVSDVAEIVSSSSAGASWVRTDDVSFIMDPDERVGKTYLRFSSCSADRIAACIPGVSSCTVSDGEVSVITGDMLEKELNEKIAALEGEGAKLSSRIRVL